MGSLETKTSCFVILAQRHPVRFARYFSNYTISSGVPHIAYSVYSYECYKTDFYIFLIALNFLLTTFYLERYS